MDEQSAVEKPLTPRPSIRMSSEIGVLAEALSKAQGSFKPLFKTRTAKITMKTGREYSYNYADLSGVIESSKEALAKNCLAIVQVFRPESMQTANLYTLLLHSSGQWIESVLQIEIPLGRPQELGSLITYIKRYEYTSILGISAEEDDDGNAASQPPSKPLVKQAPMQKEAAHRAVKDAEEVKEMDRHVKEAANETSPAEARLQVLNLLIGKGKPFAADIKKAKGWMESQAQADYDNISTYACRDMYKAAKEMK